MNKSFKRLLVWAIAAGLAAPMSAIATNGYFSHGYGVKAKGMGGAGVAYAQDALAPATNPAGILSVGNRMDFGAEVFMPVRDATVYTVAREGDESTNFLIPEFGYIKMINDKRAWGVAVYGNGGMNTDYKTGIYSTSAAVGALNDQTPTGVNLAQLFIAPTYAMKIDDTNTFGVSLNLIYQTFEADGLSNFIGFKEDPSTGKTGLTDQGEDSSTGYSIKLGWTGEINDTISMGFTYQTESEMGKFDKYKDLFANDGEFNIPAHYTLGIAIKASPQVNVAVDVQTIKYSDIPAIANKNCGFTTPHPGSCDLGDPAGPGFGWEDMTVIKLGVDYQLRDDLVVRAGWNHGGQPIPSTETAFNVIAPAVVEDHLTLGATWTMANKAELSAFFMHALENEVKGSSPGPGAGFSNAGHGDIKMSQNALGIAYGWSF
jgi:long-chain fatty acid transport protein